MEFAQASPLVQFDDSPTDSFVSTPRDNFTSLFEVATPSSPTMNPMEMMTPHSVSDDRQADEFDTPDGSKDASASNGDKKQTKKRKSWGQVLPEPKTNLPPRKRAKTDDEKEQRRVERVLRNRRAAQSSRERKRLEVEALEQRNQELEAMLEKAKEQNNLLVEQLKRVHNMDSPSLTNLSEKPLALSQELFGSQEGLDVKSSLSLTDDFVAPSKTTVNPAALSPPTTTEITLQELSDESMIKSEPTVETFASSTDLTQHPAAMLCDLQCQSVETSRTPQSSQALISPLLALSLQLQVLALSATAILSACQRPLMQIAMSSKAGFSLLPSPQLLATIIWLVTLPRGTSDPALTSLISMTSSSTKQTMPRPTLWQRATTPLRTTASTSSSLTLRFKSLRKILTSSPSLARPLLDATMVALRLASEGRDDQVEVLQSEFCGSRDADDELTQCLRSITLPSREVLMSLALALQMEDRKIRKSTALEPVSCVPQGEPTRHHVLQSVGKKQTRVS